MVPPIMSADICLKMVEAATRQCQPVAPVVPVTCVVPETANATADSLAALSTAFTFGSILLAVVTLLGAVTWGILVKGWAEKEAREEAERCTKKWIEEEGLPMLRRDMQEWKKTFSQEAPISDAEVDRMVAALGSDAKEGDDGKK